MMRACSSAGLLVCQNFDRQNGFSTNSPKFFIHKISSCTVYIPCLALDIKLLSVHHLCGRKSMQATYPGSLFICCALSTAFVEAIATSASLLIQSYIYIRGSKDFLVHINDNYLVLLFAFYSILCCMFCNHACMVLLHYTFNNTYMCVRQLECMLHQSALCNLKHYWQSCISLSLRFLR